MLIEIVYMSILFFSDDIWYVTNDIPIYPLNTLSWVKKLFSKRLLAESRFS